MSTPTPQPPAQGPRPHQGPEKVGCARAPGCGPVCLEGLNCGGLWRAKIGPDQGSLSTWASEGPQVREEVGRLGVSRHHAAE